MASEALWGFRNLIGTRRFGQMLSQIQFSGSYFGQEWVRPLKFMEF